jgi:hypothetical protein
MITDKVIALWDSRTSNSGIGNTALLNGQGSLVVNNSGNTAIWASSAQKASTSYIGCYRDSSNRAMTLVNGGSQSYTFETCQNEAVQTNSKYFALQNSSTGRNAQCALSNDLSRATGQGKQTNCTQYSTNFFSGGPWSNSIYSREIDNPYFLILQDDGNMCIYRGTGPNDNQGSIWCTQTNGKQRSPNPTYSAARGKFGKNWIPSGTSLAAGDFIGSNDGSIYLFMQNDGNLVLYTSNMVSNCSKMADGNMGAGQSGNALYDIGTTSFRKNMGKLGFVSEDNVLHPYSSDNFNLTNIYNKFANFFAEGNDIPNAQVGSVTNEQCKSICDNNSDCYGYSYNSQNRICYPKSSGMWPFGGVRSFSETIDTYVRDKTPKRLPSGVKDDTINIDTIQYEYYNKGGEPNGEYGLSIATAEQQKKLDRLESEMKVVSTKISALIDKSGEGTDNSQMQADKNLQGLDEYQMIIDKTNEKIDILNKTNDSAIKESFTDNNSSYSNINNINRILQDSDIVVLQKNYEYLLWTILATGSVIVAMNIGKK